MKRTYSINQLRDYSALFSRSEVIRILRDDFQSFNTKIIRYGVSSKKKETTYLSYLKSIYRILEKHYPNEYIYKNEFLNRWLINELGSCKSIVFNELRLGKAIADLAMFNGISKVFEIKTILDKEARLSNQIIEYRKFFNEIYVIVPASKVEKYLEIDHTIGVISYANELKEFVMVRQSARNCNIDSDSIMQVLHTKEYLSIVHQYYDFLPKCSDFEKFEVCKKLISQIPTEVLNDLFIEIMKKRKINNEFASRATTELNQLCLSLNLNSLQKEELLEKLQSPILI